MDRWTAVLRWVRKLGRGGFLVLRFLYLSICPLRSPFTEGSRFPIASHEFPNCIYNFDRIPQRRDVRFLFRLKMYIHSNSQKGLIFAGDKLAFLIRRELPVYKQGNKFEEQIHERYPKHLCLRNRSAFQTALHNRIRPFEFAARMHLKVNTRLSIGQHCSSSPIISNAVSVSSVLFSGCLWRRLFSPEETRSIYCWTPFCLFNYGVEDHTHARRPAHGEFQIARWQFFYFRR